MLDNMVIPFAMFWGTSVLFASVATPIYIHTNCAQVFPFLHILIGIYLLSFFLNLILFIFFIQQVLISHLFYTHQCIHVNPNLPIHHTTTPTPLRFPPLVSIHLFSTSVSLFLPCKEVHLYHFSRFHIYVLIYDICFSLSDLLHSVWQSLDPSTSLQMTQFHSFLWLSNIPLYIRTTTSLSIFLFPGIFKV